MRNSKKNIIELALKDADVSKCVQALVRTAPRSDQRDIVVDAFKFKFGQVATELFKHNIKSENFPENLDFRARITFSGEQELLKTTGMNNKILTILCNPDNLKFDIGTEANRNTYVILKEFDVEDKETFFSMSVFFTGDEEIDELIIKIINLLRKR